MIVGSTLKAKYAPVCATIPAVAPSPVTGTVDCTRLPNTNRAPFSWKPRSAVIMSPIRWKTNRPTSVLSTITPNTACRPRPEKTRRQLIALRL